MGAPTGEIAVHAAVRPTEGPDASPLAAVRRHDEHGVVVFVHADDEAWIVRGESMVVETTLEAPPERRVASPGADRGQSGFLVGIVQRRDRPAVDGEADRAGSRDLAAAPVRGLPSVARDPGPNTVLGLSHVTLVTAEPQLRQSGKLFDLSREADAVPALSTRSREDHGDLAVRQPVDATFGVDLRCDLVDRRITGSQATFRHGTVHPGDARTVRREFGLVAIRQIVGDAVLQFGEVQTPRRVMNQRAVRAEAPQPCEVFRRGGKVLATAVRRESEQYGELGHSRDHVRLQPIVPVGQYERNFSSKLAVVPHRVTVGNEKKLSRMALTLGVGGQE